MVDFVANATNLTNLVIYLNESHNNLIGLGLVFVIFIVCFGAFLRWGEPKAAMVASFMSMMTATVFATIGILTFDILITVIILMVILWVLIYFYVNK